MTTRVGVLDDHRSFGEAIGMALAGYDDISIVGVADCIDAVLALTRSHQVDVLLIDYQLHDGTGIEAATRLAEDGFDARLILLTAHASPDVTTRALANGFERVMSKETPLDQIAAAVRAAPSHEPVLAADPIRFSRRQREVLELMGQGLDPASIARELFISVHTARSHVKDVLRTLGAPTQLAAVTKAIREGYLLPPSKSDTHQV